MVVYDTFESSMEELTEAQDEKNKVERQIMEESIEIKSVIRNENSISVKAVNNGNQAIQIRNERSFLIDILFNGTWVTQNINYYEVQGTQTYFLAPNEKLYLEVGNVSIGEGTRVLITTPLGNQAEYTFTEISTPGFTIKDETFPFRISEDERYEFTAYPFSEKGDYKYFWDFDDGSTGSGRVINHRFSQPGVYYPALRVRNSQGEERESSIRLEVRDLTQPYASIVCNATETEDREINFASFSSDNTGVVNWSWAFGDGSIGFGEFTKNTYNQPGYFMVTLTVKDTYGNEFTSSTNIRITDITDPVPDAGEDIIGNVNTTIYFNGTKSYDPENGMIISYTWDFGDEHFGSGEFPTNTYEEEGIYQVILTVADREGNTAQDNVTVTVRNNSRGVLR